MAGKLGEGMGSDGLSDGGRSRFMLQAASGLFVVLVGAAIFRLLQVPREVAELRRDLNAAVVRLVTLESAVRDNTMTRMAPETRERFEAVGRELDGIDGRLRALESHR